MILRKISLVAVAAACLFIPASAFAGGGGHGGWHGGGWHRGHGGGGWGYGGGSCWRWTPRGYIWVCGY